MYDFLLIPAALIITGLIISGATLALAASHYIRS